MAGPTNLAGFNCCSSGSGGGGGCCITVNLYKCSAGGTPISGATVSITGMPSSPGPATYSGTTDSSGYFHYCHSTTIGTGTTVTVSYNGLTYSQTWSFCPTTINLCYTSVTVNATITPAADPVMSLDGVTSSVYPFTLTTSGSTATFTYKTLTTCGTDSTFPATFTFYSLPSNPCYISNCETVSLACGDTVAIDLTNAELDPCYFCFNEVPSTYGDCDEGCATAGKGPSYRGAIPVQVQVTFYSNPSNALTPTPWAGNIGPNLFASDEGVPIILTGTATGGVPSWTSGCRGAAGNYQSSTTGIYCGSSYSYMNHTYTGPGTVVNTPYGSTEVTMSFGGLTYYRYAQASCAASTGSCTDQCGNTTTFPAGSGAYSGAGVLCADYSNSGPTGSVCSPYAVTSVTNFDGTTTVLPGIVTPTGLWVWYAHIQEYCDGEPGGTTTTPVTNSPPTFSLVRPRQSLDPAVRDRVNACEHRGLEGGLILTYEERSCCGGGAERTLCRAGKGQRPGRVTLRECLACKANPE